MTSRRRQAKRHKKPERPGGIRTKRTADSDKYPARHRLPKRAVAPSATAEVPASFDVRRFQMPAPPRASGSKGPGPSYVSPRNATKYYEVDSVIGASCIADEVRLLVKWQGYPLDECSWEPESEVDAVDMVEDFYKVYGKPGIGASTILSPEGKRFEDWKLACCSGKIVKLE